jgi:3-methylcrotonyl-CoA carboxylase beta subunit
MWPVRIHAASLPLSLSPLFGTDNLRNLNRLPRPDVSSQNAKVSVMGSGQLSQVMQSVSRSASPRTFSTCNRLLMRALSPRDPSQHASLKAEIEAQSSSLYATARLWDDGIIKPTDTRDVVGLGLALAARQGGSSAAPSGSSGNSWSVERGGRTGCFGVYRM